MKKIELKNKIRYKLKRKICDRVIIFLAFLIEKCAEKEDYDNFFKKREKQMQQSEKYEMIMSKKDYLMAAIEKLDRKNQINDKLHMTITNKLNDVNVLIHYGEIERAHAIIVELLSKFKFQIKEKQND